MKNLPVKSPGFYEQFRFKTAAEITSFKLDNLPAGASASSFSRELDAHCYRFLLTAMGQMGFITDAGGQILEDSAGWRQFTGKSPSELKGPWTLLLHPDEKETAEAKWKQLLEAKDIYEMENRVLGANGEYRHFFIRCLPVFKNDGSVHEWAAACMDIHDYKHTEGLLKEKSIALKETLGQLEIEKKILAGQIAKNVEKLLLPVLKKLAKNASTIETEYLRLLEANLKDLTGEFGVVMSETSNLTPKEIEICNMIRNGLRTKEIAKVLKISVLTVNTHRTHIRKKLKIANEKINLSCHLR